MENLKIAYYTFNLYQYEYVLPPPQNIPSGITTIYVTDNDDTEYGALQNGWDKVIKYTNFVGETDSFKMRVNISYIKTFFYEIVPELSEYDLVFDMIGGDVLAKSFKVLKKGGTLISIKGQDTEDLAKKYGVNFEWFFMSPDGAMLTELVTLISQGTIKTVIDSTYPMEQASEAFGKLAEGRTKGKIVLTIK